jgi:glycosyltransferase involved in cell wall biosynthesis
MKISIIIPARNEETGIGTVISQIPARELQETGYSYEVIVVDNGSTDRTAKIAAGLGATVICEPKRGKGNALRSGFAAVAKDTDYVVMLDADSTYQPREIPMLLAPLSCGHCAAVVGSRLDGRIKDGSMDIVNKCGNIFFSFLVRCFYRVHVTDALTGYLAFRREVVEILQPHLESNGFTIEMEMITKLAHLRQSICSIPISYHARAGTSNLRPFNINETIRCYSISFAKLFNIIFLSLCLSTSCNRKLHSDII